MAALTQPRNTPELLGSVHHGDVAAGVTIYQGALLCRDAAGNVTPGATATGLVGIGRAEETVDNSGGAAGDATVRYASGVFRFENSGGDPIDKSHIGGKAYVVDDQTVAATDGTGTRSPAGVIEKVDAQGVWVRLDEALTANI